MTTVYVPVVGRPTLSMIPPLVPSEAEPTTRPSAARSSAVPDAMDDAVKAIVTR